MERHELDALILSTCPTLTPASLAETRAHFEATFPPPTEADLEALAEVCAQVQRP